VAYVAPILVKIHVLQEWTWKMPDGSSLPLQQAFLHLCIDRAESIAGGWAYTFAYILAWWLVLHSLYRKRLFLRI
jgi:predicted acyltransferase